MQVKSKLYLHRMAGLTTGTDSQFPLRFKKIALAITFSPRAEALLFEAVRIVRQFEAQLVLIHVGKLNAEGEATIQELVTRAGGQELAPKVVAQSGKPVEVILDVCKKEEVELLLAGALLRENLVRYFRGSIARRLVREVECSILLITNPKKESELCSKILVNGLAHPKTPDTVKTAIYVAEKLNANELIIADEVLTSKVRVRVNDDFGLKLAEKQRKYIEREEYKRLWGAIREVQIPEDLELSQQVLYGKPGYSIGHYAADKGVDMLVMNSPDSTLGILDRLFKHDIEYVLSDLPCDLLIVHTTKRTSTRSN